MKRGAGSMIVDNKNIKSQSIVHKKKKELKPAATEEFSSN